MFHQFYVLASTNVTFLGVPMCLAIPGQLLSISGDDPLEKVGKVSFGGMVKEVNLAYVPEVQVGDYVIVHVGFALSIVDEQAAQQTLTDLEQMAAIS
ncbi:MAG TPA: HypC/HybG/HupF family hydrogenase formation chaperone [Candidatus Obscuribacterales bacterium]